MERDQLVRLSDKLCVISDSLSVLEKKLDSADLLPFVSRAVDDLVSSSTWIRDRYYSETALKTVDGLSHSDILANLISRTASHLYQSGNVAESDLLAKANKLLHGIDFFPRNPIPDVFMLVHPVGSVIGRITLPTLSVIYQGVSVGARLPNEGECSYPRFSGPVVLFANSSVFGNCLVGKNVVFGAGSMVVECDIPDDSVVVGQFPNHRFLPGGKKIIDKYFVNRQLRKSKA